MTHSPPISRRALLSSALAGVSTLTLPSMVHAQAASAHVVVVGGGFGGATVARYLRQRAPQVRVTLIEPAKRFVTCPFSNFKLAGLCARTHGPSSVGLITLDTYRVGAHEQLRTYGRMLGVVAHLAHDRAALQDLLGLLANKKMVLIDTTGIAPNDPRKRDMMDMLDLPGVNRLLVLNAGGHGDTLDDMVSAFKTTSLQQTILSKTDEAAKIGPALDATIRHQLVLRGVTTGQKVPEDWERADAANLIAMSMRSPAKSAFDPKVTDLGFFFAQSSPMQPGQLHA